jgi:hypothetical protein
MIEIHFIENLENYNHGDLIIEFPSIGRKFVGDTYWFVIGKDNYNDYSDIVRDVIRHFRKLYDIINQLWIDRSYFWSFLYWDQGEEGVLFTNIDNKTIKLKFFSTGKFLHGTEYIFEKEEFSIDREQFLFDFNNVLKLYESGLS